MFVQREECAIHMEFTTLLPQQLAQVDTSVGKELVSEALTNVQLGSIALQVKEYLPCSTTPAQPDFIAVKEHL